MSGSKEIPDLPAAGPIDGSELVHIVQGGNSRFAEIGDIVPPGVIEATVAQIHAGAIGGAYVSPRRLFEASAPVALAIVAAAVAVDLNGGINFNLTMTGPAVLSNPTNAKPGQSGRIRVKQDATGGRLLTFGANWLFVGGDPTLSTAANAIDVIYYFVNAANEIEASFGKALA